jgi:hypothetical protein
VQVYVDRPSPKDALFAALTVIRNVDVTVSQNTGNPARFNVLPGASLTPAQLASTAFRLNGVSPADNEEILTGGRIVGFPTGALFDRDVNYLLVELAGKKSFFAFK